MATLRHRLQLRPAILQRIGRSGGPILMLLVGIGLYSWRLQWQPLWADEGYSLYFASEPLLRMLQLTAADIHPPLYYALLHGWLRLFGSTDPLLVRLASLIMLLPALPLFAGLVTRLFPQRPRLLLIASVLFTCNPLLLFYSQEVRMYGLALTLALASTLCCWQALTCERANWRWWVAYLLTATAALYTLYYTAFLLVAHLLWAGTPRRKVRGDWRTMLVAQLGVGLLFLPWLIYTATTLIAYVDHKVQADQDIALPPLVYLTRHLLAFVGGHLIPPPPWSALRWVGLAALLWLGITALLRRWQRRTTVASSPADAAALQALSYWVIVPALIAFLINLRFPFFPAGGERLLLFILPYGLLLVAVAIDDHWPRWGNGPVSLAALLISAGTGIGVFYSQPHHQTTDYRPLIRQIVQQGDDHDTVLATFPWQVGLWRAYTPQIGLPTDVGPQLRLLSDRAVAWDATVETAVDQALTAGALWLPLLQSIGSTLPAEFEGYLRGKATNLVNRWYGDTTLTAWRALPAPTIAAIDADWGTVKLQGVGVAPSTVAAANQPLRVDLAWAAAATPAAGLTLRLQRDDYLWVSRDLPTLAPTVGLIVGAGLPPGAYQLQLGITGHTDDQAAELLPLLGQDTNLLTVATIQVTAPSTAVPAVRLPIQYPVTASTGDAELTLLGYSGDTTTPLAGEALALTLFWQKSHTGDQPYQLYVSLLNAAGEGVAGWEGWPLPTYPPEQWAAGAVVQTPVTIGLPPTLPSGDYQLGAGLIERASGVKGPWIPLGAQAVDQRQATFTPLTPPQPLATPAQFGTHALLQGYAIQREGATLTLQLYWQVLQTLWPPHHIFVHLDSAQGVTLTQADGAPTTAAGRAPTGSWLPGEYLITTHQLTITALPEHAHLQVGLYLPATGARLPVSSNGQAAGDAVIIPVK